MSVISMKQLLEAGVHFGHQTRRWNPKMAPYIYTERNGIYIIDLQKSVGKVDEAYKAVSDIADSMFLNANSKQAPQIVDRQVQPILDQSEVYSGCYGNGTGIGSKILKGLSQSNWCNPQDRKSVV